LASGGKFRRRVVFEVVMQECKKGGGGGQDEQVTADSGDGLGFKPKAGSAGEEGDKGFGRRGGTLRVRGGM